MSKVSSCVEKYLTSKKNAKESPFRHIINSIGIVEKVPTREQKNNAKEFWTKFKEWMQGATGKKSEFEGITIEQLAELMLLSKVNPRRFAEIQNKMVSALQKARKQIQAMKGNTDQVTVGEELLDKGEEFKKVLSELKEAFTPWGGRPKNFVPICTYHHQLVAYQDYEFIPLIQIEVLKVYQDFQKLLPEATE